LIHSSFERAGGGDKVVYMTEAQTSSPTPAKQQYISEHLRREIIEGRLAPGGRLPTQVQLVEQFRVSGVTIQRALDRLIREGFIYTRGRNGTFVASHPPHLYSYGVVFRDEPRAGRSRYHEMLEAQAFRLQRASDRKVTIFNGITGLEDTENSRRLLSLVRSHQMAGLLLIDGDTFHGTPLLEEKGIFRAAIMSRKVESLACPIVYPDMTGMIDLALDTLVARGRRRVATLITVPVYLEIGDYLRNAMKAREIITYDRWRQIVPHDVPEAVRNSVLMLMTPGIERPDGLFIVDDNLVEGASSGLVEAGVNVPGDIEVVAHCNFPWSLPVLPMQRVGFDTRQIMEAAVNVIDLQRQGQRAPSVTRIGAVLEESGWIAPQ
jgi:DNA-binding LacI/PurR family transcriptional regulator/DNA-binding transcriptional regulator YhcF (GntR family)